MVSSPSSCRFGQFVFDPASGELTGPTGTTRLQPQVAALLDYLTAHAGAVVTRAELQRRLWPDTTVEFDDGLNFCIRQLRVALGDDANAPTCIETLPRRGYRFLPAVSRGDATPAAPLPPDGAGAARRRALALGGILIGIVAIGVVLFRPDRARRDRVMLGILPFSADTSDSLVSAYGRRLNDQLTAAARAESAWTIASPGVTPTHVLSGTLTRDEHRMKVFVQLVDAAGHRKLWGDDLVDLYAFQGNSTMTADRIEKAVARILADTSARRAGPPR